VAPALTPRRRRWLEQEALLGDDPCACALPCWLLVWRIRRINRAGPGWSTLGGPRGVERRRLFYYRPRSLQPWGRGGGLQHGGTWLENAGWVHCPQITGVTSNPRAPTGGGLGRWPRISAGGSFGGDARTGFACGVSYRSEGTSQLHGHCTWAWLPNRRPLTCCFCGRFQWPDGRPGREACAVSRRRCCAGNAIMDILTCMRRRPLRPPTRYPLRCAPAVLLN